ncbi:MAG: alpha/beta hydrolase [Cellulosilyticaceae bacterium]
MKRQYKKVIIRGSLIIGILILVACVGVSIFTANAMIEGAYKQNTREQTKQNAVEFVEQQGFSIEAFEQMYGQYKEQITLPSSWADHEITADYITCDGEKDRDTIILVHGLGGDRYMMYPLAQMFLEQGYNVLTYDQRNAGDNTAEYTTFGYLESLDLQDCVTFVRSQVGPIQQVGVLGQSMGGATTGFYAGTAHANENVDFAILDGPFNDAYEMIESVMYDMNTGIPVPYLMACGSIGSKMKLGFFYEEMNVSGRIKETQVPVLVIVSKADKTCPDYMGERIYEAIPHTQKMLWVQQDIEHIMGYYVEPVLYQNEIMGFIEDYVKTP